MASKGKGATRRVSLRLPESMVERLEEIAGPYRGLNSVIAEALAEYLDSCRLRDLERVAQNSEEYKILLEKIRRDLGLADQPEASGE